MNIYNSTVWKERLVLKSNWTHLEHDSWRQWRGVGCEVLETNLGNQWLHTTHSTRFHIFHFEAGPNWMFEHSSDETITKCLVSFSFQREQFYPQSLNMFLPASQFILRTENCSWNRCHFCKSCLPSEDIKSHVDTMWTLRNLCRAIRS